MSKRMNRLIGLMIKRNLKDNISFKGKIADIDYRIHIIDYLDQALELRYEDINLSNALEVKIFLSLTDRLIRVFENTSLISYLSPYNVQHYRRVKIPFPFEYELYEITRFDLIRSKLPGRKHTLNSIPDIKLGSNYKIFL